MRESSRSRWLLAGAFSLTTTGCIVYPETIRDEHNVGYRFGPPRDVGPAAPRLLASSRERSIELLAIAVRPCTKQRIEVVDEHVVREAKLAGKFDAPSGGGGLGGAIVVLAVVGVELAVLTTSALFTGLTLAVGGADRHHHSERVVGVARMECPSPLADAHVRLTFAGGLERVVVTDVGGRALLEVPAELVEAGEARASLAGLGAEATVRYSAAEGAHGAQPSASESEPSP